MTTHTHDSVPDAADRSRLGRRAQLLAGASVTYNVVEAVIAGLAVKEGRDAWRGEGCCGSTSSTRCCAPDAIDLAPSKQAHR